MKKLLAVLLVIGAANAIADSVYLEPQYTVAIESGIYESTTQTLTTKTVTPIVYEDSVLPAGESVTFSCQDNKTKLTQVGSKSYSIPVTLGTPYKIATTCGTPNALLIWSSDEYKIKSDRITKINDKGFSVIPFNINNSANSSAKVIGVTSDGNLTNITVNKAKYFKDAKFFGTLNGISYILQYSNDDEKFTIHAANLQKLTITDKDGQILSTIDFPSYE